MSSAAGSALILRQPDSIRLSQGLWDSMPSLFRLLFVLFLIGGAIYGGMLALVTYVEPEQREMTIRIPGDRLLRDE